MSNKPLRPDKQGKAAFQLETLEKRILFSADLPFPVAELSSLNTTGYIGLVSAAESFAQSSTFSANSEQHSQTPVEIVIIDSATPDHESIVADLEKQANSALHVVILDAERDGIEQISEVLGQFENVGALHLISHGSDAQLSLGNSTVDFTELLVRADEFAAWQDSFTADADLLIYGCDLASTDIGRSFVSTLGNLTGMDVAASDDLTGSALLGADWDLEYRTGAVDTNVVLSDVLQNTWNGVLSATVDSSSSGSTTGSILTVSHTTSGTERLMIVGISMDAQTSASVSSVTYNGSALTLVGTIQNAGSNVRVELWQMVAPATGTNDVVVTFSQAMTEGGIAGVVTFNGVDQTTPLGSFASAGSPGNGTNALVNISADVGDLVFSTMGIDGSSDTALNEAGGQTEHWEIFQTGTEGAGSTKVATSTSENMSWTFASNQWAIGGVAIKASSVEPPVNTVPGAQTVNENTPLAISGISVADDDDNLSTVQLTVSNGALNVALSGAATISAGTNDSGNLTLSGSLVDINATLASLTYQGNPNFNGSDTLTVLSTDSSAATDNDTVAITVDTIIAPAPSLWISTDADSSAPGADGLPNGWKQGEVVQLGGADQTLGDITDGDFSSVIDFDNFVTGASGGVDVGALHYVSRDITLGGVGGSFNLQAGDILVSFNQDETIAAAYHSTATDTLVDDQDLLVFRPTTSGDYTDGTFHMLLDDVPNTTGSPISSLHGISLVEQDVNVGGSLLTAGTFIFSEQGGVAEEDIYHFTADSVGTGTTTGTTTTLIDGTDIDIQSTMAVRGLELVERSATVGGLAMNEGSILVTLRDNDASVGNTTPIATTTHDIFMLNVTSTGVGTTAATATMVLDGSDVNLDTNPVPEKIYAIALFNGSTQLDLPAADINYTENDVPTTIDPTVTVADPDSPDLDGGALQVQFTAGGTTSDVLSIVSGGNVTLTGSNVLVSAVTVGTFSGGNAGTPLVINWNANSTPSAVEEVTRQIAYSNTSDDPSTTTRTVEFTLSDGDGGGSAPVSTNIDVTAVNDAPTLTTFAAVVETSNEDTEVEISFADLAAQGNQADVDGTVDAFVVQSVASGTLKIGTSAGTATAWAAGTNDTIDATNHAYWTPATDANGTQNAFAVVAKDDQGAESASNITAQVSVTPVNDAPVLAGANDLTSIDEDPVSNDGTLVSALITGQVTDVDSSSVEGIAVIGVDDTNGTWEYTTDGGTNWLAFGAVDISAARLLAADANSSVRFVPDADWHGTVTNGISFHAWDQTSGTSGGSADLSAIATVRDEFSTIDWGNDNGSANWTGAWVENEAGGAGPDKGNLQVKNAQMMINASVIGDNIHREADISSATSATLTYAYDSSSLNNGEVLLQISGDGGTNFTTLHTFSSANSGTGTGSFDISSYISADTQIRLYVTDSAASNRTLNLDNIQIEYTSSAVGGNTAFSVDATSSNVTVNSVVDTPSVTNTTTNEDTQSTSGLVISRNLADGAEVTHFKITGITDGALYKNDGVTQITSGSFITFAEGNAGLKFTPDADFNGTGNFTIHGSTSNIDAGLGGSTVVANVTVNPVNDAPVATGNTVIASEDVPLVIGPSDFNFTDAEGDSLSSVTITGLTLNGGTLTHSAGAVTVTNGMTITAAELADLTFTSAPNDSTDSSFTYTVNDSGTGVTSALMNITVNPVNNGPTITSTAGTTATEDTLYTYTATVSDPDDANNGTDLTWSLSGAPAGMVVSSTGVVTWTPTEGVTTSGAVTLTVSDGNEDGAVDATEVFTISVTPVNDGPTITSTAGTTATEDTLYTYTATVSDPDDANNGTDLTWSLSGAPTGMVVSSTGVVTWTPAEGVTTSGAVTLTVSDGNEDGAVDATEVFTINVTPVNDGPTITSTAGTTATEDILYTYTATVTDPDDANNGTDLTWSLSGAPAGMVVSSTGVVTWTPAEGVTTSGAVTLTVSDGNEDGAVDATEVFTISVTPVNDGPVITSTAGTTATEDTLYTYTATVTDPDDANNGTDLTWSLSGAPAGMVVSSTGVVTWTPTEGVTTSGAVTLTVSDGNEDGAVDATEVFTISVTPVNDGPTITSTAGTAATEDTLYTYTATVSDPDDANNGTDLTWSLSGAPAGMVVSSTGVVTWIPTEGVTTSGAVTLTVSDGNEDGAVDETEVFTISVTPVNDGPVITSTAGTTATEDTLYTYTATVTDPDDANNGTDLTWSLSGAPAGMVVSSTGVVTWTPTEGVTTSGAVTLTVSDGNEDGAVDATEVFTISVTPVNDGPTITSTAGTAATEDTLYTYTATVSDPDDANNGTDLTWSLSGAPAGMVVSSTGVVTWIPTEGVTTSGAVTLTVSDGNEDGAVDETEVFTISVTPVNDGPVITSTAGTTATEDTLYTYTATVTDPDDANNGTDLTWSLSGAPAGMVVSSTGVVTWTPAEGVTTSGAVTLTVSDGNEDGAVNATEVFTISVTPVNDGPTITSTAGTTATEDILYTYTATVTDPDDANNGTDLTWSLSGAPAGMVVSSTGVVTWTPAEGVTTSGAVTLTVSDGNEDGAVDATEVFTISVTPVNDGPTITSTAGTTATEDTLYTYTATVSDPDDANNGTDLTWSLSGAPAGMVVSSTGVVTWTPAEGVTTSGTVTLTVSDGNEDGAVDATEVFTISVTPVNDGPVITSTAGTTATEDTLYTYTATVTDPDDANNGTDLTWSLSGAPAGMVVSNTGVVTWTPTEGVTTSGAVTLTVSDGNEDGAVDATEVFTIAVTPVNDGPTITSTAGTAATEDTLYTYTATVSDPDDANNGTDLTWSLSGAPAGMVVSSTGVVTWIPTEGVTTSGAVTLTVSDGNEDGAVDETEVFTISVTPVNDGPVITSTAGTTATEDTLYAYTATVSDPDDANNGTDLSWSLSGAPAGMVVSSTGVVTWTPTEGVTTSGAVTLTVSDGNEDGAVDATEVFTITVTPVNDGPTITSTAGTTTTEDTLYTYTAIVSDPDDANNGTDLTWNLSGAPAGMVVSSTGVVTWTPTEGVTTSGAVTLTVSDGNEDGAVDATEVFTISVTPVNDGPVITSTAGTTATEDTLYTYTATVTDPNDANNGTDLTWSLSGAPAGMVVSSTGVVTWTPTEGVTTSGAVTLTVSDGNEDGAVDATEVFTINVTPVNDGPTITSTAGTTATEDILYTYTATVTDPDDANNGTDLTWSLSGAPAGMVVSSTGVVTWTPAEGVTTSGAVTLTVSDGNEDGAVDATEVFTISVTPVNDGPTITSTAGTTATEDILYTYTATVTDPDDANNGTDLTWRLSGAPAGMVVSSTGVVTWTPMEGVTTSGAVTLTVSDGNEDGAVDATEVFIISVTPVNDGPVITSTASTTATEDTLYTYTATVSDPDDANNGTDLTWSLSGAPAGMVVSSTGVVTWTPAEGVTTSGAVTLTVSDGNENGAVDATEVFTISVTPVNDVPMATGNTVIASEDVPLVIGPSDFGFTDVEGDSLASVTITGLTLNGGTLTHSAGTVPVTNGMTITVEELADLTFTSALNSSTDSSFTYTVNDSGTGVTSALMNITVNAVNDVPTFGSVPVTAATEDAAYHYAIATTDVDGNSLTITATTLPTWLTLTDNGDATASLSGTPTNSDVGSHAVVLEVTDGNTVTTQSFSIGVTDTNDAPTFTSPTTFTVAENVHSVATLTSVDVDGAAPTYSLVGSADDDRFIINATTGELRFLNAPDFENAIDAGANNTYNLSVQVSDGRGAAVTQALTVTVNDVNEAPSLAAVELTATEGFIGTIGQLILTDPDAGDELTISIVGGTAQGFFSVDPNSGALTQQSTLTSGVYTLEVLLNDANGMSTTAVLQIRIDAAEPDLGAANNTTSDPDISESSRTTEFGLETGYAPAVPTIDSPAHTGIQVIAKNGDTAGLAFTAILEEPASEASSSISATGDTINTLFPANSPAAHHFSEPSNATEAERTDSQSRGYSLVLELLFGEAEEAFDEFGNAFASVMDGSLFSITLTPDMLNALSSMHSDVDEQQQQADERLGLVLKVGTVASVTFTVGFVTWLLQTGSLLATAMSTAPLWRAIDPVPVLKASQDNDDDPPRTGTHP